MTIKATYKGYKIMKNIGSRPYCIQDHRYPLQEDQIWYSFTSLRAAKSFIDRNLN